jgi:uncharacterized DUF497 family protein
VEFEWDPNKATRNLDKHQVSFQEAATVFGDPLSTTFQDPDHSLGESRYLMFGLSSRGRLLVIAHAERGGRIRIISARVATQYERMSHEERT